jgi:hypothetical protein
LTSLKPSGARPRVTLGGAALTAILAVALIVAVAQVAPQPRRGHLPRPAVSGTPGEITLELTWDDDQIPPDRWDSIVFSYNVGELYEDNIHPQPQNVTHFAGNGTWSVTAGARGTSLLLRA